MPDPYAVDAAYYDLIHGRGGDDIGLWLSFAGRTDQPVLEVGAGTGRIALELARAGHEVVAIDPSPAMLAVARERAEADAIEGVSFIEGLPVDLALEPGHYGLVVVPADVFLYHETGHDQVRTLQSLGAALHFSGLLALDLPGPALWLDPTTNGQPLLVFSGELESGEQLDAWHVHEDDLGEQLRRLRVTYERTAADGIVRRASSEHLLRYVYRFEAEYLLAMAGLAQVDVYGDYELGPLTNDSERMIVIARRAEA
ncbi:MAG: class I SAM-dependent methyltransferase [Chloroflexi bacterium]|nr:class I SAM-dependent methyltransferase [Chloroflexota bacterium]